MKNTSLQLHKADNKLIRKDYSTAVPKSQNLDEIDEIIRIINEHVNEDPDIQNEYLTALSERDEEKINWFASMGESPRHRICNVNDYRQGLLFGFTEIVMNDSGWIEFQKPWITEEEISLKIKGDNAYHNNFTIVQSPNNKWTFGVNIVYGSSAGYGYAPSVYQEIYNSRAEAMDAAFSLFTKELTDYMNREYTSQSNISYIKTVLAKIELLNPKSLQNQQLMLF